MLPVPGAQGALRGAFCRNRLGSEEDGTLHGAEVHLEICRLVSDMDRHDDGKNGEGIRHLPSAE